MLLADQTALGRLHIPLWKHNKKVAIKPRPCMHTAGHPYCAPRDDNIRPTVPPLLYSHPAFVGMLGQECTATFLLRFLLLMPLAGRVPDRWRPMVVARATLRYNGHPAARLSPWGMRVSSMAHGILCWARSGAAPRARNRRPWPHMGRSTASCGVLDGPPASVRARRRGLAGHSGGCLALARAAACVLVLPSQV